MRCALSKSISNVVENKLRLQGSFGIVLQNKITPVSTPLNLEKLGQYGLAYTLIVKKTVLL